MSGYIFNLNNMDSLQDCIKNGCYSTILSAPKNNNWQIHHEGTFADFLSMKPGDNIYFFIKRKIYGIGVLTLIGQDCKYLNYPGATIPKNNKFKDIRNQMLLGDSQDNINNRCICVFKPSPYFFMNGVDMDEALSYKPDSIRSLRAYWKVSFIQIDDEENQALFDIILKKNESSLTTASNTFNYSEDFHKKLLKQVDSNYAVSSMDILNSCNKGDYIKHEMAIETGIIDLISNKRDSIFGPWDYVSHQVIASPFKPIDYMDKMDIFGYKFIPSFKTISKYLLIELKKDSAKKEDVDQAMKYVDWINQEYSYGDYSMIEAFLVAYDFPREVVKHKTSICERNYMKGRRPTLSETWTNLELIKYSYDTDTGSLEFSSID